MGGSVSGYLHIWSQVDCPNQFIGTYISQHKCLSFTFTIGSSLVSHFTHWLSIHQFTALEFPIGYSYPLEIQRWISLDWNHYYWINSHTKTLTISNWIEHSLTCIIGHWLKLTLKPLHEVNYYVPINTRTCSDRKLVS